MRILLFLLIAYAPFSVRAAPSNQEVLRLLEGYEWELLPENFEELPEDSYLTLMEIASDPNVLPFYKGRAVAALSLYQNDQVWSFFERSIGEVGNTDESQSKSRRSVDAMCRAFSSSRGEALKKLLRPRLKSKNSHFRVQTALCLRNLQFISSDQLTTSALMDYEYNIATQWERDKVFR